MMTFEETMAFGADQYSDVLEALDRVGLPSTFTQTGGMNAAIEVQLETGHVLLVTDAEDSVAWVRAEHDGWAVGLYGPGERDDVTPTSVWPKPDGVSRGSGNTSTSPRRSRPSRRSWQSGRAL